MVINYDLQLHTELSVQLQTELVEEADIPVRNAIEKWLEPIFTKTAKDVDLRFYTVETDEQKYGIQEVINDNRTSYTFRLPKENYMHLAIANISGNNHVQSSGEDHSATMQLSVSEPKDISSLNTGVFTARLPMEVHDSISQTFEVHLYMVTSAVALVIDPSDCADIVTLTGRTTGSANGFEVRDSVYTYTESYPVNMDWLDIDKTASAPAHKNKPYHAEEFKPRVCLGAVCMPTKDGSDWTVTANATLTDNRHTTTTLTLKEPLKAGELKIIQCKLDSTGKADPTDAEVGASVELDWKPGGNHDIEI